MRDAFAARLKELALRDPRIMLLTADLGFGVLKDFATALPRQFLNVGVAEQNLTGLATGLALDGRIVFTYSIANFPTLRCLEQVRNDAAYHQANVKIVSIGGGFSYGALGMSHHATEDLAILRALPITVVAPGCDWEAVEATSALAALPGTCYLRLDRSTAGSTQKPGESFRLGKARRLREGSDMTLVATGGMLASVLEAADSLARAGVACRVLSVHTVKPLDAQALAEAARETGGIVTVEEHGIDGGLGSAVAEACLDAGAAPARFFRMALRGGFATAVGSQEYLRCRYGLGVEDVRATVLRLLGDRSRPALVTDSVAPARGGRA